MSFHEGEMPRTFIQSVVLLLKEIISLICCSRLHQKIAQSRTLFEKCLYALCSVRAQGRDTLFYVETSMFCCQLFPLSFYLKQMCDSGTDDLVSLSFGKDHPFLLSYSHHLSRHCLLVCFPNVISFEIFSHFARLDGLLH